MKKINIFSIFAVLALLLAGCNEAPFSSERENGKNKYGEFHKSSLTFDVREGAGILVQTRATSVDINKFKLQFLRDGQLETEVDYGDMPEIMLLEQGTYIVKASYGSNVEAAWDSPFFEGESKEFTVTAQAITTSIDPIVCELKNVMVTVTFDSSLQDAADDDSYIEVKIKNGSGLKYYNNAKKNGGEAGYFRINDETTLVATFYGKINGSDVEQETKSLADVEGGNHYKMTFSLHGQNSSNNGSAQGQVNVDASVEYVDKETNVEIKEELFDDNERPSQDDPIVDPGKDPEGGDKDPEGGDKDPDEGNNPPAGNGPEVIPSGGISLDDWNENPSTCALTIESATGVTGFIVDIESPALTPEELAGVGLASHMDLVTCKGTTPDGEIDMTEAFGGLGLKCGNQVLNQKKVEFDISGFMPLLAVLGNGDHTFILKVTDASGTREEKLRIRINY